MDKFLVAWGEYAAMMDKQLDTKKDMKKMKKSLTQSPRRRHALRQDDRRAA